MNDVQPTEFCFFKHCYRVVFKFYDCGHDLEWEQNDFMHTQLVDIEGFFDYLMNIHNCYLIYFVFDMFLLFLQRVICTRLLPTKERVISLQQTGLELLYFK